MNNQQVVVMFAISVRPDRRSGPRTGPALPDPVRSGDRTFRHRTGSDQGCVTTDEFQNVVTSFQLFFVNKTTYVNKQLTFVYKQLTFVYKQLTL